MEITIFAKKRTNKEGKTFYNFLSTLNRKDGTTETVRVAFRDTGDNTAPKPDSCPRNIIIDKQACNMASRRYTDPNTGEIKESKTLWVTGWQPGSEYIDHSMDDYE